MRISVWWQEFGLRISCNSVPKKARFADRITLYSTTVTILWPRFEYMRADYVGQQG